MSIFFRKDVMNVISEGSVMNIELPSIRLLWDFGSCSFKRPDKIDLLHMAPITYHMFVRFNLKRRVNNKTTTTITHKTTVVHVLVYRLKEIYIYI